MGRRVQRGGYHVGPGSQDRAVAHDHGSKRTTASGAYVLDSVVDGATEKILIGQDSVYLFWSNRWPMAAQFTTFHQALTYSTRRF